jgi:hypothetical protein
LGSLVNKKRKEAERRIQQLIADHRFMREDVVVVENMLKLEAELAKDRDEWEYRKTCLSNKIADICGLLCKHGFLCGKAALRGTGGSPELTRKGNIAASLAEMNPIVMAEFLETTFYMRDLSAIQMVRLLSCFTDVKVSPEVKLSVPNTQDRVLRETIERYGQIIDSYRKYSDYDNIAISNSGSENDLELVYDLVDMMEEWCLCEDEAQCKGFIQTKLAEKSISIGDFTKAILKMSTMVKELMNVCEQHEEMLELWSKSGTIDAMILKYITTAQSLYV